MCGGLNSVAKPPSLWRRGRCSHRLTKLSKAVGKQSYYLIYGKLHLKDEVEKQKTRKVSTRVTWSWFQRPLSQGRSLRLWEFPYL